MTDSIERVGVVGAGQMGVFTGGGDDHWLIQNGLSVNPTIFGLFLSPADWSVLGYGATNAGTDGIRLSGSATFRGNLVVGNNVTDCNNAGGTGLSSGCAPEAASDFTLTSGVQASLAFAGRVTSDDFANGSDTDGSSGAGLPSDWFAFENEYRSWAKPLSR